MENASKALLIAGGILMAVLIIGLLMYVWISVGDYTSQAEDQKLKEQLTAFNKQYEAYQRQILRGSDIASVINKIRDNNKMYSEQAENQITWEFTLERGVVGALGKGTYREESSGQYDKIVQENKDNFKAFKALYFRCSSIEYNKSGRVNKMVFKEILAEQLFDER